MYFICRFTGTNLLGEPNYIIDFFKGTVLVNHIKGTIFKSMIFVEIFSVIYSG